MDPPEKTVEPIGDAAARRICAADSAALMSILVESDKNLDVEVSRKPSFETNL